MIIESVKAEAKQATFDMVLVENNESLEECLHALNENQRNLPLKKERMTTTCKTLFGNLYFILIIYEAFKS